MSKVEWRKTVSEALTPVYRLYIDDNAGNIKFDGIEFKDQKERRGAKLAEAQLLEDVRNVAVTRFTPSVVAEVVKQLVLLFPKL